MTFEVPVLGAPSKCESWIDHGCLSAIAMRYIGHVVKPARLFSIILTLVIGPAAPNDYFVVRVTDEATGRGVPLIELKLPNEVRYWTDSAGIAAIREPAFEKHDVFVAVSGHGYEFPKETFFGRGVDLTLKPGSRADIKV